MPDDPDENVIKFADKKSLFGPEYTEGTPEYKAKFFLTFLDNAIMMLQDTTTNKWFDLQSKQSKETLATIQLFINENLGHPKLNEIVEKNDEIKSLIESRFEDPKAHKDFKNGVIAQIKRLQIKEGDGTAQIRLNDFYDNWAVVDDHGKTWVFHLAQKGHISRRTMEQFKSYHFDDRIVKDDGTRRTRVPIAEIWLANSGNGKRKYPKILFDPSQPFDPKSDTLNLWRNFVVAPKEGDCHLMAEFVLNVICCGNSAHYNWLIAYYAHMVQKPWEKPGTAIVLRGIKRIGKSFFGRKMGYLIDGPFDPLNDIKHYFPTEKRNDLFGDHTGHLEYVLMMQLEELVRARSHKDESTMKEVTTGETMSIRPMYAPSRIVKNYIRPLLISNADWAVPITWDESRYFVLEVATDHKDDIPYFAAIDKEWYSGGAEAWMHKLKNYDISGYNLREAPRTKAAFKQQIESLRGIDRWFLERLNQYDLPFVDFDYSNGRPTLLRGAAYDDFCDWGGVVREGDRSDKTKFGDKLRELVPWIKEGWHTPNGLGSKGRVHAQIWPSLQECRDFWVTKFGNGKRPPHWDEFILNWENKESARDITSSINVFQTNKEWSEYMKEWAKEQEKRVSELDGILEILYPADKCN